MKSKIFIILFTIVGLKIFAQDIITLKTGEEIPAKILEVDEINIKYKKWDYQDGPSFTVAKAKIFMIKYQNGSKEVMDNAASSPANIQGNSDSKAYGKNIMATNLLSIISLSYERLSKNEKVGFRIPITFPLLFSLDSKLSAGFDAKFYIGKTKVVNYFVGPSVMGGIVAVTSYRTAPFLSLLANNGISINPANGFNITIAGAGGLGVAREGNYSFYTFDWRAELIFGVRF